ncbi:YcjF family protein [Colwellia sp. MEBiC06753]
MSDNSKYQQQILFEEQEINVQQPSDLALTQQVIVDNDDWQSADASIAVEDELMATETSHSRSWLSPLLLLVLVTVVGIELYDFFINGFIESPILTSLYGVLVVGVGIFSASSLIKEFSGLRQLKKREQLRVQLAAIAEENSHGKAETLLTQVSKSLSNDLTSEQELRWQNVLSQEYSDQELLSLYSREVLTETDQKAMAEVARYASESVVLVALSPIALLDMFIMVWRNLTLVDKVAGLYGLKLGYWSRIKLVKQVFINMIYAGASEVIVDVSADMLGADLLGKLSGRLAQGLGAGMLTARLGLKTIYLCRPIPFDDNAPKLSQVRKEVVGQIRHLFKSNQKA